MIITTLSADSLCKSQVIALGRQMEDNYRQLVFDCSCFGDGITGVTLVHMRSKDTAPYIVETSDTDQLTWTISDTDTAYYGYGKAELRISFADGLAKSITFTTLTVKSITADVTIPEPLQSWYDAMIEYIDEHSVTLDEVDQLVEEYLEEHPIQAPVQSVNSMTGDVVITAASLGALTSETDPVFGASAAAGITAADITAWNGKYTKPASGIPATDLTSTVQSRLLKTGGSTGQVLAKVSGTNYDVAWTTVSGGGAVDSVNGQTGTVVLDADDVGALPDTTTASDLGAYVKPSTGIPKEDLASAVQTSLGKADTALQTAPVTSVNGQTGAVSLSIPTKTSDLNNDSGYITSAPVASVDGKTGTVTVIPTGGSTGQVLAKASATDRDVEWITPASGGGDTWRVIADITTTEEVLSINITEDSNGNPFALKEFRAFASAPKCTQASNGQWGVNSYWMDSTGGFNTGSGRHGSFAMKLNPDNTATSMFEQFGIGGYNTTNFSTINGGFYDGRLIQARSFPNGFTEIHLRQSNTSYPLPVGTYICVYGVDKS